MITLSNLAEKSAQEVFDHVKNHLLKQNKQSIHYGKCYYRLETPQGVLKCAAGCLISDEEYKKEFEDSSWWGLVHAKTAPKKNVELISHLQAAHDTFNSNQLTWEIVLKDVADKFNLNY